MLGKEQLHLVEILKYSAMPRKESRALWTVVKGFAELRKTQSSKGAVNMCQPETPKPRENLLSCRRPGFKSALYREGFEPKEVSQHWAFAAVLPWVGFSSNS